LRARRAGDGQLTRAATYATGGNGGVAAPGTESDHLASQGSLAYDAADGVLGLPVGIEGIAST
jgi:hypothetical protein